MSYVIEKETWLRARGAPDVHQFFWYPVAQTAGLDEIADDGGLPPYYPLIVPSTNSNSEASPGVAWMETLNFEQEGIIEVLDIWLYAEWQSKVTVGGGDATNTISKMQISRDGGANWVDMTDNYTHAGVGMVMREREGIGLWVTSIVAGANQLALRLAHWTDDSVGGAGRSSSEARIRSCTMLTISYLKTGA